MEGRFTDALLDKSDVKNLADELERICIKYIFSNCDIRKIELTGKKIIFNLLDTFVPAVLYYDSDLDEPNKDENKRLRSLLSENYFNAYKKASDKKDRKEKLYLRLLLVTDNICGMTDSYAKSLYQELNGIS
ncbi:hypothetical protein [Listeria floridensis]|uniref:hypothetical protein n=1 Tax=Listeria floridensis TaxID=1494962 RepID=UPI001F4D2137|nr:hypothetical protein [Listeria floridensis]